MEHHRISSSGSTEHYPKGVEADEFANSNGNCAANNKTLEFSKKIFRSRNSYLTDLFEIKHFNTVYNIFLVIFNVLLLKSILNDLTVHGRVYLGLNVIAQAFAGQFAAIFIWLGMHMMVFAFYYFFEFWAEIRFKLKSNPSTRTTWNYFCILGIILYQFSFAYHISLWIIKFNVGIAGSYGLQMEMAGCMMKMYAFVRHNAPLQRRTKSSHEVKIQIPSISTYVYYVFAPVLVYQEIYPKTSRIRWKFVAKCLLEWLGVIFCITMLFEGHLKKNFSDFGSPERNMLSVMSSLCDFILPGTLILLCGFFSSLHTIMNLKAELLCFADRMFYKDWWNSTNSDEFFRTWNVPVHDWMYEYVYKDMYLYVFKGSRNASALIVFIISTIFHEFIIAIMMRFFYPVMFLLFGFVAVPLFFCSKTRIYRKIGNFTVWLMLSIGYSLMVGLYSIEYYARSNCQAGNEFRDYFIPVSWNCSSSKIIGISNL